MDDYLWNFRGQPDPVVQRLERILATRRLRSGSRGSLFWLLPLAAAAALLGSASLRRPSQQERQPEAIVAEPEIDEVESTSPAAAQRTDICDPVAADAMPAPK